MSITIELVQSAEDMTAVIETQKRNLYPEDKGDIANARTEWVLKGPGVNYLLMKDGDKAIGSIAVIQMPFSQNGWDLTGGMLSDFCLDEEYRVGFNAIRLFNQALKDPDCDFIYGTPNDKSEPLFKRGFEAYEFKKYVKVLDTKPYLKEKYGKVGFMAGFVVNAALHVINSLTKPVFFDFEIGNFKYVPSDLSNHMFHNGLYSVNTNKFIDWRYNFYYNNYGNYKTFSIHYNGLTAYVIYTIDEDGRARVSEINSTNCDLNFILHQFESFIKKEYNAISVSFEFVGFPILEKALKLRLYKERVNNHRAYLKKQNKVDISGAIRHNGVNLLTKDGDFV